MLIAQRGSVRHTLAFSIRFWATQFCASGTDVGRRGAVKRDGFNRQKLECDSPHWPPTKNGAFGAAGLMTDAAYGGAGARHRRLQPVAAMRRKKTPSNGS